MVLPFFGRHIRTRLAEELAAQPATKLGNQLAAQPFVQSSVAFLRSQSELPQDVAGIFPAAILECAF